MIELDLEQVYNLWFTDEDIIISRGAFYFVLRKAWWLDDPRASHRREIWVFRYGSSEPEEMAGPFNLFEACEYLKNFK